MPRYGFNFQWMFSRPRDNADPAEADLKALDFMARHGLTFVRIPTDYRFWTRGFDYANPREEILEYLDRYLEECRSRGLHLCLNLHRAPGYCVNRQDLEKHTLWKDAEAQDGFVFLWELFARRYRGITNDSISFDLVNEPRGDAADRQGHEAVVRRTVAAIRAIDPQREICVDGWHCGNDPLPELADLDVIQSGRGYQPFQLTHFKATWCNGMMDLPVPAYPGVDTSGRFWDADTLRHVYKPWRDLEDRGVPVHIGEFGCFRHTPNDVALRWFADLLALFREYGWGYSLWGFTGSFGIIEHERPGTVYEEMDGYKVDRALLELYLQNRVEQ